MERSVHLGPLEGDDLARLVMSLEEEMREAAKELRFEYAARLGGEVNELRGSCVRMRRLASDIG